MAKYLIGSQSADCKLTPKQKDDSKELLETFEKAMYNDQTPSQERLEYLKEMTKTFLLKN